MCGLRALIHPHKETRRVSDNSVHLGGGNRWITKKKGLTRECQREGRQPIYLLFAFNLASVRNLHSFSKEGKRHT